MQVPWVQEAKAVGRDVTHHVCCVSVTAGRHTFHGGLRSSDCGAAGQTAANTVRAADASKTPFCSAVLQLLRLFAGTDPLHHNRMPVCMLSQMHLPRCIKYGVLNHSRLCQDSRLQRAIANQAEDEVAPEVQQFDGDVCCSSVGVVWADACDVDKGERYNVRWIAGTGV